jgi:lipopolysaccharide export system permease protein
MPPITLFRYMFARMAVAIVGLGAALAAIVFLTDLIESLRFAGKTGGDFGFAVQVTLLRTPAVTMTLLPFIFLFAAIWMFRELNRRSELAVMRAAGLSVWRLIGPPALLAALTGILVITLVDPLSTRMLSYAETMKSEARGQASSLVRFFGDGIWLRQRDRDETLLINAAAFDAATGGLSGVTVWRLSRGAVFEERIDAPAATLTGRTIELKDARMRLAGGGVSQRTPNYSIPTNLSLVNVRNSTPLPETMSVWDLPRFILIADSVGLSTVRYNMRFHDLCSTPLKLTAMVLIAALFSLGPVRQGGAFKLLLAAVGAGFGLYILSELAAALGEMAAVPEALAAWTPALAVAVLAIALLMRVEEG